MDTDKTSANLDDPAAGPQATSDTSDQASADKAANNAASDMPREFNGPKGPEPTRYGDWEQKGRCSDF